MAHSVAGAPPGVAIQISDRRADPRDQLVDVDRAVGHVGLAHEVLEEAAARACKSSAPHSEWREQQTNASICAAKLSSAQRDSAAQRSAAQLSSRRFTLRFGSTAVDGTDGIRTRVAQELPCALTLAQCLQPDHASARRPCRPLRIFRRERARLRIFRRQA